MQNPYTKEKDIEDTTKEKISDYASTIKQGEEKIKRVVSEVEQQFKQGQEKVKQLASAADKQLHENPWPVVSGVAATCLLIGFIMGQSKRNT